MSKKRVLILTNYAGAYTGFGRNAKSLLRYLYNNYGDKIEIIQAAGGMAKESPDFNRFPWITEGVISNNPQELQRINQDEGIRRAAAYGAFAIEELVNKYKPDAVVAIEDEWGVNFIKHKEFSKHIPTIFWVTLDSLPIMKDAIDSAKKVTQYWTWSGFATNALKEKGVENVVTQYPCIENSVFKRLPLLDRLTLRRKFGIPDNAYICGFVFRNQLRKLVDKLIQGYATFKRQHPEIQNTYLYTHTHYGEGWNIPELCEQYGVNPKEVLCTYVCRATREYFVAPFHGQDLDNPVAKIPKSLVTTNVTNGVTEEQLNEIYNLMDLYVHPATSGACEMPCVEAALTELPIATCGYSFGEDIIKLNKGAFEIEYIFNTEIGTQFLKSIPNINSIAKIMNRFYNLEPRKKQELGRLSRQWALDNYSTEVNGKKIAEAILALPAHNWDFVVKNQQKNDQYPMPDIKDNLTWVKDLYKNILAMELPDNDPGILNWMDRLEKNTKREDIYAYFINVAKQDNAKNVRIDFNELLNKEDVGKRILVTMPESAGDVLMATSLLPSIKELYPDHNIYFATKPEYMELLEGNELIFKVLPWIPEMDNLMWLEGAAAHKGFFEVAYLLHANTQRFLTYLHNGKDRTNVDFLQEEIKTPAIPFKEHRNFQYEGTGEGILFAYPDGTWAEEAIKNLKIVDPYLQTK